MLINEIASSDAFNVQQASIGKRERHGLAGLQSSPYLLTRQQGATHFLTRPVFNILPFSPNYTLRPPRRVQKFSTRALTLSLFLFVYFVNGCPFRSAAANNPIDQFFPLFFQRVIFPVPPATRRNSRSATISFTPQQQFRQTSSCNFAYKLAATFLPYLVIRTIPQLPRNLVSARRFLFPCHFQLQRERPYPVGRFLAPLDRRGVLFSVRYETVIDYSVAYFDVALRIIRRIQHRAPVFAKYPSIERFPRVNHDTCSLCFLLFINRPPTGSRGSIYPLRVRAEPCRIV